MQFEIRCDTSAFTEFEWDDFYVTIKFLKNLFEGWVEKVVVSESQPVIGGRTMRAVTFATTLRVPRGAFSFTVQFCEQGRWRSFDDDRPPGSQIEFHAYAPTYLRSSSTYELDLLRRHELRTEVIYEVAQDALTRLAGRFGGESPTFAGKAGAVLRAIGVRRLLQQSTPTGQAQLGPNR